MSEGKSGGSVEIFVTAPGSSLTRIRLRWHGAFPMDWHYLGDHWERSYGDLEFRGLAGDRLMPWYFLATNGQRRRSRCGVKTGASAICYWQVDAAGVTLSISMSAMAAPVFTSALAVFTPPQSSPARTISGESPMDAARSFCAVMCQKPILPSSPVYGSNNWYYAYGNNTSAERSLRDAQLLVELVPSNISNRPFCVIDMGWHAARDGAGPSRQTNSAYPDMPGLAQKMVALGVRPGIWTRPTLTSEPKAQAWRCLPPGDALRET